MYYTAHRPQWLWWVFIRLWKDHLKNDLRSDQDHRQKIDLRSRSRSRFLKYDLRSRSKINFCPKSPLFGGYFLQDFLIFLSVNFLLVL
jgi:hypothetical protein